LRENPWSHERPKPTIIDLTPRSFFIYDPKKCIDNSYAFRAELEKARIVEGRDVEVITLILN